MTATERLLDALSGPLTPEDREKLRMAVLAPSVDAWDGIYGIVIQPNYTVWMVVSAIDPRCPRIVHFDGGLAGKWGGYCPDSFTLRRALVQAAANETDTSSHG